MNASEPDKPQSSGELTCCCPYKGVRISRSLSNDEHVFPQAIGYKSSFIVPAETKLNNDLGRDVDAPFVDQSFILPFRVHYGMCEHATIEKTEQLENVGSTMIRLMIKKGALTASVPMKKVNVGQNKAYFVGSDWKDVTHHSERAATKASLK